MNKFGGSLDIMRTRLSLLLISCLTLFGIASLSHARFQTFGVVKKFTIGGEGGWDYLTVDQSGKRLFITRGTHVQVMDTSTGKILADIKDTQGVHGVALDEKSGKGYISCGRSNIVMIFDLKSYSITGKIAVGQNPDAILFDPVTGRIFTFNGRSNDVSVVDTKSNKVLGTIKVSGKPEFAQSDMLGHVFVNIEDKSEITEFDAKSMKVIKSWSLSPAEEPSGLAIDLKGKRLFSVCSNNKMAISDFSQGKLTGTVTIGDGPDAAAFDPALGLAFSSNGGSGTMTVVKPGTGNSSVAVQEVKTQVSGRTMTIDAKHHLLYTIVAQFEAPAAGQRRGKMVPNSATIVVVGTTK